MVEAKKKLAKIDPAFADLYRVFCKAEVDRLINPALEGNLIAAATAITTYINGGTQ